MTFEDAIKKSIKQFYNGKIKLQLSGDKEQRLPSKYTVEYFNRLEQQVLNEVKR